MRPPDKILTWTGPDGEPMKTETYVEPRQVRRPNKTIYNFVWGISVGEIILFAGSAGLLLSKGDLYNASVPLALTGAAAYLRTRLRR